MVTTLMILHQESPTYGQPFGSGPSKFTDFSIIRFERIGFFENSFTVEFVTSPLKLQLEVIELTSKSQP